MKPLLFTLTLFCISMYAFGQTDLEKEIFSFTDSTEIIIRNGRKLIVEKIVTGNREEAIQTLDYLKGKVDNSYVILYPYEEILVSLASSNFDLFLFNAKKYNSLMEGKTKTVQVDDISTPIHNFLAQELPLIKKDLAQLKFSKEDMEFINLYISYYEGGDKTDLQRAIRKYQKLYPESDNNSFLDQIKMYTNTGYMNFCLGYGHEFLNGDISNAITEHFQIMSMDLEWFINRTYISFFMNGSVSGIYSKQDIPVIKKDLIHYEGNKAFSLKYGAKIGYSYYSTQNINLFSYVTLGGYQINSDQSNFEDSGSTVKYKLSNSFLTGIGTACNITIKNFKSKYSDENIGLFFIKANVGYDFILSNKNFSKGGSLYFQLSWGLVLEVKLSRVNW